MDMSLPPKRERGCRGKASLIRVAGYIKAHQMDRLGFDVEPATFYNDNSLRATRYFPPVPSAVLEHIDQQLNNSKIPRILRRRFQRVIQKITVAVTLPDQPNITTEPRLGIAKTMHLEQMVSTIDRISCS